MLAAACGCGRHEAVVVLVPCAVVVGVEGMAWQQTVAVAAGAWGL